MQPDPVLSAIRERRAAQFNYDAAAIARDARQRNAIGDRQVVRHEPRLAVQVAWDSIPSYGINPKTNALTSAKTVSRRSRLMVSIA